MAASHSVRHFVSSLLRERLGWAAALVGIVAFLATSGPAYAGWPGANGHIAFASDIPSLCCEGVYTVAADGTGLVPVYTEPSQDLSVSEYSPDGRWLLVNRANAGLCSAGNPIYALRDNGLVQQESDLVLLDDPIQPTDTFPPNCTRDGRGVYSLDGSRIAFPRSN